MAQNLRYYKAGAVPPPFSADPVGQGAGIWTPVWGDEFTGSSVAVLDPTAGQVQLSPGGPVWQTWYPAWERFLDQDPGGNHTNTSDLSYMALSQVSLGAVASCVTLTSAHTTTVAGLPYTSGMIQSLPDGLPGFSQQFGYFEARLRISSTADGDLWPAWWMANSTVNIWPPEIDIFEWISGDPTAYNFNIFQTTTPETNTPDVSNLTNFHVFGCKWAPNSVVGYLDGVQVASSTLDLETPQYLLLDLASRTGATHSSATMDIDYVRVWK